MIKVFRIFGLIGMIIALSLIGKGSPSCGEEPLLSIELQPEISVYDVRIPLGALGRVQGRADVAYRASRAMVDVSDEVITIDDILESLQGAGVGGIAVKIVMPEVVHCRKEDEWTSTVRRLSGWRWGLKVEASGKGAGKLVAPSSISPAEERVALRFEGPAGDRSIVYLRVHWSQPTMIAAHDLKRGAIVAIDDLLLDVVNLSRSRRYPSSPDEILGSVLNRDLRRAEALTVDDFKRLPLVERGTIVRLVYKAGGLVVEMPGKALEDGFKGEGVKVRNERTKKVIVGVVAGDGFVLVEGG
ncbi:flagellar basal body P-ring formation chaperone FlgA [Acetomicrobium sp. S15 = DSM 107314]|uniref:flagellar basal body P-ring formation chaperone FlgA n=1 Tax=Acetomicrobium sp. S15 = DSM 107314 TaxID=2529858 RepID=UPI0018E131ED|nr:flagellar basal body P-ring formation chaperone FlgA [Acetomicrobium sp. S15 = DSM 107314]